MGVLWFNCHESAVVAGNRMCEYQHFMDTKLESSIVPTSNNQRAVHLGVEAVDCQIHSCQSLSQNGKRVAWNEGGFMAEAMWEGSVVISNHVQ